MAVDDRTGALAEPPSEDPADRRTLDAPLGRGAVPRGDASPDAADTRPAAVPAATPPGASASTPVLEATGDPRSEAAAGPGSEEVNWVARIDALDGRGDAPLAEQIELYDSLHADLKRRLGEVDAH